MAERDRQSSGNQRSLTDMGGPYSLTYRPGSPSNITQGNSSDWFGPLNPLAPIAPESVKGRILDYPSGYNLNVRPRSYSSITFEMLRAFADRYDILRLLIETRKDQMSRLGWNIVPRDSKLNKRGAEVPAELQTRIQKVYDFFLMPDQENFWGDWLRLLLEDLFVIDAPTIYRRRTYGGELYALQPLDGGTIKRVIDNWGNTPEPPAPAYQQVLKGYPAVDYTTEELIYRPRVRRTNQIYGYSPVEQVVMTINIGMRRQAWQLESFTEGNIPEALIGTPDTWTPDQVRQFQDWFDSMLQGNTGERRRARFVPGDVAKSYVPTKPTELFGQAEEWLVRVMCFAFNISPQPFVQMMNRATSETAQETAALDGLAPIQNWVKGLMDYLLIKDFKSPDLEFKWLEEDELDPDKKSQIIDREQAAGRLTFNEARKEQGLDPIDHPNADRPMFKAADGWKPIFLTPEEEAEAKAMAEQIAGKEPGGEGEEAEDTPPGGGEVSSDDAEGADGDEDPDEGVAKADKHRHPTGKFASLTLKQGVRSDMSSYFPVDTSQRSEVWRMGGNTDQSNEERQFAIPGYVDFSNVIATQDYIDHDKAAEYARDPSKKSDNPLVHVIDGKHYLQDGHHRAVGIRVSGAKGMVMAVVNKSVSKSEVGEHTEFPFIGCCHDHGRIVSKADESDVPDLPAYPDPLRPKANKAETKLAKKIARVLARLKRSVVAQLTALKKADNPEEEVQAILDSLDLAILAMAQDDLEDFLDEIASDSARLVLSQMGITNVSDDIVDRVNERALNWATNRAAELVSFDDSVDPLLAQSTRDMLRATIADGIKNNIGMPEIAKQIEQNYAFSEERAHVIASTEITSANSEGALNSYREAEEAGVKVKKSWLRLGDACPICVGNADAGAIPLDEPFPSGDMAPGAHPYCRCVLVPEVEETQS